MGWTLSIFRGRPQVGVRTKYGARPNKASRETRYISIQVLVISKFERGQVA